jgi:hypothetical protein
LAIATQVVGAGDRRGNLRHASLKGLSERLHVAVADHSP